jgi:hypothetical protein
MATDCIAQTTFRFHRIPQAIVARFDQPSASSDGGAVLLKAVDDRLGLTWRLASALRDRRQPGKVAHPLRDLLRQRVFGLACGYADGNDAARLADDPIHMSTVAQGEPPRVTHVEPVRRRDRRLRMQVSSYPSGGEWRSASWCARPGSWPR